MSNTVKVKSVKVHVEHCVKVKCMDVYVEHCVEVCDCEGVCRTLCKSEVCEGV